MAKHEASAYEGGPTVRWLKVSSAAGPSGRTAGNGGSAWRRRVRSSPVAEDVESQNIVIEWRWGRGRTTRFPEFATEAVRLPVDIVVTANTAAGFAVQKATKTTPIVIATMADPVGCLAGAPPGATSLG